MHSTNVFDGFGRRVSICKERFTSTSFAGLLPIASLLAKHRVLDPALTALAKHAPIKKNATHSPEAMFKQRLFGLLAGFEDLTDHNVIQGDPGFRQALGTKHCASGATLCRFENSLSRQAIDALNKALLDTLAAANEVFGMIPAPTNDRNRCLFLDVDSTHIDLFGNQERKSYNGHYGCSCLAPVLCFVNQWPVAVFNAAGTRDARDVLLPQLGRLVRRLKKAFPGHTLVIRADSGFNSNALVNICEKHGCFFLTGLGPNKASQRLASQGLSNAVRKTVKRFTTDGHAKRILGELDYQAKSWTTPRRIIARKQFDPKRNQLDLRLIQTNIRRCKRGEDGFCPYLSRMSIVNLYEVAYCQRGRCEQSIEEFKSECFGRRASATRFGTNSYRMLLAAFCQFVLKLSRFALLRKKAARMSARTFRRNLVLVTAQIQMTRSDLILRLPSFMLDEESFFDLYKIPIA